MSSINNCSFFKEFSQIASNITNRKAALERKVLIPPGERPREFLDAKKKLKEQLDSIEVEVKELKSKVNSLGEFDSFLSSSESTATDYALELEKIITYVTKYGYTPPTEKVKEKQETKEEEEESPIKSEDPEEEEEQIDMKEDDDVDNLQLLSPELSEVAKEILKNNSKQFKKQYAKVDPSCATTLPTTPSAKYSHRPIYQSPFVHKKISELPNLRNKTPASVHRQSVYSTLTGEKSMQKFPKFVVSPETPRITNSYKMTSFHNTPGVSSCQKTPRIYSSHKKYGAPRSLKILKETSQRDFSVPTLRLNDQILTDNREEIDAQDLQNDSKALEELDDSLASPELTSMKIPIPARFQSIGLVKPKLFTETPNVLKQNPGNPSGTKQHPGNQSGLKQHPGNQSGSKQHPGNQSGSKQHPGNQSGLKQHPGNQSGLKQHPGNRSGSKQPPGYQSISKQTEINVAKSSPLKDFSDDDDLVEPVLSDVTINMLKEFNLGSNNSYSNSNRMAAPELKTSSEFHSKNSYKINNPSLTKVRDIPQCVKENMLPDVSSEYIKVNRSHKEAIVGRRSASLKDEECMPPPNCDRSFSQAMLQYNHVPASPMPLRKHF